ncbi:MAG TPA: hypothetical protein VGO81_08275, partial [Solirubrobacteraceae bacterium]|nr:hypothetical protein [Solirubrobacteraceae bacterium]
AAGVGLLVIVLLVLGINGCLASRHEQALKDYNRDVASIVQDANANCKAFFDTLTSGGSSSTDVQSQINQLRVAAVGFTKRASSLPVPGDMKPAHRNLLLSLGLVQESMGKVAEKLPSALSTDTATAEPAVTGIAGEMQAFLAGDVVYTRRTAALIKQVLDDKQIGGQTIQKSQFLQNLGWLQPSTVARRINADAARGAGDGGTSEPTPGLHGHGLLSVAVGGITLQPRPAANRIAASSNVTFDVKFANQGDNTETNVKVRIRIRGAGKAITAQKTVDQTLAKSQTTVQVPLGQAPPVGQAVTITAEVVPVPGETNTTNNSQDYSALFTGA